MSNFSVLFSRFLDFLAFLWPSPKTRVYRGPAVALSRVQVPKVAPAAIPIRELKQRVEFPAYTGKGAPAAPGAPALPPPSAELLDRLGKETKVPPVVVAVTERPVEAVRPSKIYIIEAPKPSFSTVPSTGSGRDARTLQGLAPLTMSEEEMRKALGKR